MVKIYQSKILGWWHLLNTSSLAKDSLPPVVEIQADADMFLQAEFVSDEVYSIKQLLKFILSDGVVETEKNGELDTIKELCRKAAGKLLSIGIKI